MVLSDLVKVLNVKISCLVIKKKSILVLLEDTPFQ